MKLKFLLLISSLLLVPLTSGEVLSSRPLECITSEAEEEIYVDVSAPLADDVTIEEGGNFGNEALVQGFSGITSVEITVRLSVGGNSMAPDTSELPTYITYCRLKIAC